MKIRKSNSAKCFRHSKQQLNKNTFKLTSEGSNRMATCPWVLSHVHGGHGFFHSTLHHIITWTNALEAKYKTWDLGEIYSRRVSQISNKYGSVKFSNFYNISLALEPENFSETFEERRREPQVVKLQSSYLVVKLLHVMYPKFGGWVGWGLRRETPTPSPFPPPSQNNSGKIFFSFAKTS